MQATCQVPECDRPAEIRGIACRPHISRLYRHGTLETRPKPTPMERMWARITEQPGPTGGPPCWIYSGDDAGNGYQRIKVNGKRHMAHRWMWEQTYGPIAAGLELDHLCRNPPCCNPAHLEPVTRKVNSDRGFSPWGINARKTHCKHGHEFTPENTYRHTNGGRMCKACAAIASTKYRETHREKRNEAQRRRRAAAREA